MIKVSIIIPTYLSKTKHFLDACIDSIQNLNFDQDEIEVIIVGRQDYLPEYKLPNVRSIMRPNNEGEFAEAINAGILSSNTESKYLFLLNDDVILTKDSLARLVGVAADNPMIVNPISPCDNGTMYELIFQFIKNEQRHILMQQQYEWDDLKEYLVDLMNADSIYPHGLIAANYLCMFATLLPRSILDQVGLFDEDFKSGQEDLDYSIRAHEKGIRTFYLTNAVVWHFSGKTAEHTVDNPKRKYNILHFKEKYGFYPPGLTKQQLKDVGID